MTESIGPGSTTKFKVTRAISRALLEHTRYVANLKLWDRFLIWRYTLGSGALNTTLIGIAKDDQLIFWTYNLFKSYNYDPSQIGKPFIPYTRFFGAVNAKQYLYSPDRLDIAKTIINLVILRLERIILSSPTIARDFYVYKVSTKYPGLPDSTQGTVMDIVHQLPFNSTTYNPQFNFAPFIAEDSTCCLHRIHISTGSQVLMVPAEYHAYPHEMECLLPFGADFRVVEVKQETFEYIPKEQQTFILVQDLDALVIGQVYMVDPVSDNTTKRKQLTYYISELRTPK